VDLNLHQSDVQLLYWIKVLISGVSVCGLIFFSSGRIFLAEWPRSPGGIWEQCGAV